MNRGNVPFFLTLLVCSSWLAASQSTQSSLSDWNTRLEALRPTEPQDYFELAEEIADAAAAPDDRELAQHLFALAGALDPDRFGRSSCLALADMEADQLAKRRLLALAALMGTGSAIEKGLVASSTADFGSTSALAAGEALSHYRKGNGSQALSSLRRGGAQQLLETHQRFIPGGFARFLEDCKHYRGQLKPTLSSNDVSRMLRLEAALLSGADQTWENDMLLNRGKPLIEVDPMRLAESLGVDASKPLFRRGRWTDR